jgi:hypothetical protein
MKNQSPASDGGRHLHVLSLPPAEELPWPGRPGACVSGLVPSFMVIKLHLMRVDATSDINVLDPVRQHGCGQGDSDGLPPGVSADVADNDDPPAAIAGRSLAAGRRSVAVPRRTAHPVPAARAAHRWGPWRRSSGHSRSPSDLRNTVLLSGMVEPIHRRVKVSPPPAGQVDRCGLDTATSIVQSCSVGPNAVLSDARAQQGAHATNPQGRSPLTRETSFAG